MAGNSPARSASSASASKIGAGDDRRATCRRARPLPARRRHRAMLASLLPASAGTENPLGAARLRPLEPREIKTMLKVIEVLADSEKSWEDAAQTAVKNASKTVRGIRSIWIQEQSATVEKNKIVSYRVNAKISFELDGKR
ncbi:MAG: dodecin family protein [Dongiaceae bacterium]